MRALVPATVFLALLLAACDGDHPLSNLAPDHGKKEALTASQLCGASKQGPGPAIPAEIVEASGMAASREHEDVLWLHNDSGDSARVFAIDRDGALLGTYTLEGAAATDWEDMAIGPGPGDGDYLYLADIGDNEAVRESITVYRVPEPDVVTGDTPVAPTLTDIEALELRYPDRPHDAETLLVDPVSGDLVIVTKELTDPPSRVFRAPGDISPGAPVTLQAAGEIDFLAIGAGFEPPEGAPPLVAGAPHLPTAGDVSPDGGLIAIRTYGTIWVWDRAEDTPLVDAFAGAPCQAPSAVEEQGESLAIDEDGRGFVTVSEGENAPLSHFAVR